MPDAARVREAGGPAALVWEEIAGGVGVVVASVIKTPGECEDRRRLDSHSFR